MEKSFEYYRIFSTNDPDIPLIKEDTDTDYLYKTKRRIENPELMVFKLAEPIPRIPKFVDYHWTPRTVLSQKIYEILAPLNINTIQLLPAIIEDTKGNKHENYWGLKHLRKMDCLDRELSDCEFKSYGLNNIKKLVLDKKILQEIPLEDRLIFLLGEQPYDLFHVSIVNAIMEINPEGIQFINIEDFNKRTYFS